MSQGNSKKKRITPYIDASLARRLEAYCLANRMSESAVVEEALTQYLDGIADPSLLLRRLDRLGRATARVQRDLELVSEAFAVFTKLWFAHTPPVPDDMKPSARTNAQIRFRQFVDHVTEQFADGHRFLDDLPREFLGDDAELSAASELRPVEHKTRQ